MYILYSVVRLIIKTSVKKFEVLENKTIANDGP